MTVTNYFDIFETIRAHTINLLFKISYLQMTDENGASFFERLSFRTSYKISICEFEHVMFRLTLTQHL